MRATWQRHDQFKPEYYRENIVYPDMEDEIYSSGFWVTDFLDVDIIDIFYKHLAPEIGVMPKGKVHLHGYKLTVGDHYRLHTDDRGDTGFIWYLSKNWKPDWGGLLVETNEMKVTVPQFNKVVVRQARTPHLVTAVEKWAKEPRYMLVGFF
jgi:Rps23 Pro-64 3,4-dihydroxylase Tpa1-like proline 4-hydroxylase